MSSAILSLLCLFIDTLLIKVLHRPDIHLPLIAIFMKQRGILYNQMLIWWFNRNNRMWCISFYNLLTAFFYTHHIPVDHQPHLLLSPNEVGSFVSINEQFPADLATTIPKALTIPDGIYLLQCPYKRHLIYSLNLLTTYNMILYRFHDFYPFV